MNPLELAKSGFIYTGREDNVQCVGCSAEIGDWELGDSPEIEHKKVSPLCVFVADIDINIEENDISNNIQEAKSNIEKNVNETSNETIIDIHEDIKVEEMDIEGINSTILNINVHGGKNTENIVDVETNRMDFHREIKIEEMEIEENNSSNINVHEGKSTTENMINGVETNMDFRKIIKIEEMDNDEKIEIEENDVLNTKINEKVMTEKTFDDEENSFVDVLNDLSNEIKSDCLQTLDNVKNFKTKNDLPEPKTYRCDLCINAFPTRQEFADHYREDRKKGKKCAKCDRVFNSKCVLRKHFNSSHKKYHKCDICDGQFPKYSDFQYHMAYVHTITVQDEEVHEGEKTLKVNIHEGNKQENVDKVTKNQYNSIL